MHVGVCVCVWERNSGSVAPSNRLGFPVSGIEMGFLEREVV